MGAQDVYLPHTRVCSGKCTVDRCSHREHTKGARIRRGKLPFAQREAIIAGFKPKQDAQFKVEWEAKLAEHNIDRYVACTRTHVCMYVCTMYGVHVHVCMYVC